jgi:hypothetical protein
MALPNAMQEKREALKAEEAGTPVVPAETAVPVVAPVAAPVVQAETVTISRAEFNKLQAAGDTVKAAEGKTLALANDLEVLTRRLTELEEAAKDTGKPAASASPGQFGEVHAEQLTAEILKDFDEDSVKLMQQIAQNTVAAAINPLIKKIEKVLGDLNTNVATTSSTVAKVNQQTFVGKVEDKTKDLGMDVEALVHSEFWGPFLQSTDDASGMTYGQIAMQHNQAENVDGMARVLRTFHSKYFGNGTSAAAKGTGYEGAAPSPSNAVATKETPEGSEILNFSDRQEAHRKYLNKEIDFAEYEAIKKKFDLADKENRVDYNK